ncbi:MAG: DUF177 domain-containing protein [Bacteroidales bacterium]
MELIDIRGLKPGEHIFDYQLDNEFFKSYDNNFVDDAKVMVRAVLTKESIWMKLDLGIKGVVTVPCDRCLAPLDLPIDLNFSFTIKTSIYSGKEMAEVADDVILINETDTELDLNQLVYDYICLSLPLKKVHLDGECDPIMMEKIKNILK